jgi:recombinational DNA repair ATPase RecF
MRIIAFEFRDPNPGGWSLSKLHLHEGLNLFVGASGAGKTRVLNMLFNISVFIASDTRFCNGTWTLSFEHLGKEYAWSYNGIYDEDRNPRVISEKLVIQNEGDQHVELFS